MFYRILHPIRFYRAYRRIWNELTPEEQAVLESDAMSDEVKDAVATQIAKRAFPEAAW